MAHHTGHDRIQINDDHGFLGLGVEQHIVDLGVIMGHPQGQLTGNLHIRQLTGQIPDAQHPLQLFPDFFQPAGGIGLHRSHQLGIAVPGVVEIGNGLRQQADLKICQIRLEFAKSHTGIADDLQIMDGIVCNGIDVVGHAPEVAAIFHIGLAVVGMMEMQGHLTRLLSPDMLRHQVNILHQTHGIPEGIGIDVLDQEGLGAAICQTEVNLVGLVHVTHLDGFITQEFIFNLK